MSAVAIIVGSGQLTLPTIELSARGVGRSTPYGLASAEPLWAHVGGRDVFVLPRHGVDHQFAPHQINYRANVHLLAELGVREMVAINTVGGIAAQARNGALVLPDQLIDYSWGRAHTYADGSDLRHVEFTDPYDQGLRQHLLSAAGRVGVTLADGGVYGCTQGPRFETAAEIRRMERDGCTLVGMTGMPEASLARELAVRYASVCLVVNPAAGKGDAIDLAQIADIAATGMRSVTRLLVEFLQGFES